MLVGRVCRADVTVFLWHLSTCSLRVPNAALERLFGGAVLAGLDLDLGGVWLFRRRCSEGAVLAGLDLDLGGVWLFRRWCSEVLGGCLLDVFAEVT